MVLTPHPQTVTIGKALTTVSDAGSLAAETTSSRRRLAQLSINALPDNEVREIPKLETTAIKSTTDRMDPTTTDATDLAQKARLGRRRSSLFRPPDV